MDDTWGSVLLPFLIVGGGLSLIILWALFRPQKKIRKDKYNRRH